MSQPQSSFTAAVSDQTRLMTVGNNYVSVIGPKLWNALSVAINSCDTVDTFKMKLKTFLFNEAKKRY